MRQIKLFGILVTGFVVLNSFVNSTNSTPSDWVLGHFKTDVNLGEGMRPVYIHVWNLTDEATTIVDGPNGIGCEDKWSIDNSDANEATLTKTTTGTCTTINTIVLENISEGLMTASFYNAYPGTPVAVGDFNRYATIPE